MGWRWIIFLEVLDLMSSSDDWKKIVTQKITVDPEKCIGDGSCVRVCPFMVYEMKEAPGGKKKKRAVPVHQEDCFLCQSCQAQCPVDAITIEW